MKNHSKKSKVSIKSILCVLMLIIGISAFSIMRLNATTVFDNPLSYFSLTPHDPIYITYDSNFTDYGFPGSGTAEDPYLIEGYDITTTYEVGIFITDTTKYFTVRNCYVDADDTGIYIDNVADGTATVANNTCNNNWYGIYLFLSYNSTLVNNTCINNNDDGIYIYGSGSLTIANNTCNSNGGGISLDDSSSSTVANNTCNNNINYGIWLVFSVNSTVTNNMCSNNDGEGIALFDSGSSMVANNTCYNNDEGILLDFSGSSTVVNNTCNNNIWEGIYLDDSGDSTVANNICNNNELGILFDSSSFCNITYNLLQENILYGVFSVYGSDNCTIHHNTFDDNKPGGTSQALDDGSNNTWYDAEKLEGNYWSDWSGTGSYAIDGSAGSVDLYPLGEPTVDIELPFIVEIIHSPFTPTELDTISINANITDTSDVQSVTLHYRINGGAWTEVSMTLISGDLYSVTIGPFAVSNTIEYYVSSIDNSANHNEAINDNSGLYYSFTVSEVIPEFQMVSLLLPAITFLFLIFGLMVLQRRKK